MTKDFRARVHDILPGTQAWRTERTKTIVVRLPTGLERSFDRVDACIAWVQSQVPGARPAPAALPTLPPASLAALTRFLHETL
jgi:hypothetical protein